MDDKNSKNSNAITAEQNILKMRQELAERHKKRISEKIPDENIKKVQPEVKNERHELIKEFVEDFAKKFFQRSIDDDDDSGDENDNSQNSPRGSKNIVGINDFKRKNMSEKYGDGKHQNSPKPAKNIVGLSDFKNNSKSFKISKKEQKTKIFDNDSNPGNIIGLSNLDVDDSGDDNKKNIISMRKELAAKHKKTKILNSLKDIIEFDDIKRAASIITRAVKKYILPEVINADDLKNIPPIYRYRINVSQINILLQKRKSEEKNENPIYMDRELKKVIQESLELECSKNIDSKVTYWYLIDLRTYGDTEINEIFISEKNQFISLTNKQIDNIYKAWNLVNSGTNAGILFEQMIAHSKTLAQLYQIK